MINAPSLESLPSAPLLTAEFDIDPSAVYARLRNTYGPVAPVNLAGVPVWLVLGYQQVLDVLRNDTTWRSDIRHWRAHREGKLPTNWPLLTGYEIRQTMFLDGAEHGAARQTLYSALESFQDVRTQRGWGLRAAVLRYADELITTLANETGLTGIADLNAQYTKPLVLMLVHRLFGFPDELDSDVLSSFWQMLDGGPDAAAATARILEDMTELAAYRRAAPGDDFPSAMLAADPSLSDAQLGRELFVNAVYLTEATGNMILSTLLQFLGRSVTPTGNVPDRVITDMVNWVALHNPPIVNLNFRFPSQDVQMGNFLIRTGDVVVPSLAGAHEELASLGHAGGASRAHLAWGAGPHRCPSGAQELTVTVVRAAVSRVFEHLADAELAIPPSRLPWHSGLSVRGLRHLPVRYAIKPTSSVLILERPAPSLGVAGEPRGALAALRRGLRGIRR